MQTIMRCSWLLICVLTHTIQASSVLYTHDENVHLESNGSSSQHAALSSRHCAQLCTRDPSCAAANYDHDTSQCELLTSPVMSTTQQTGSSAMMGHLKVTVAGLLAFWPLNKRFGGQDLMSNVSEIHLHGVSFSDSSSEWRSPPVRFSGSSASYGQIINSEHLRLARSFSWMASILIEVAQDAPLFSVDRGAGYGAHIWFLSGKLYVAAYFHSFNANMFYPTNMPINQWCTVAVAYDHDSDLVSLWVDGQLQQKQWPSSSEDMLSSDTVSIAKRCTDPADSRYFNGEMTCMSLYDKVMTYEEMYDSTMPLCKTN